MDRTALAILSLLSLFAISCGLIEEDGDISITTPVPVEFTVDANELCPDGQDCSQEQTAAPMDQPLGEIETDINIDVVEQTGEERLAQYAGSFKSIEIVAIDYEVANNDLTFDLPELDIYLGPFEAEKTDDAGVAKLTTIPTIPAATNPSGTAAATSAGRQASADALQDLTFSAIPKTQPVVKEGQPFPPSGSADLTLTIKIKFTANPIDNN